MFFAVLVPLVKTSASDLLSCTPHSAHSSSTWLINTMMICTFYLLLYWYCSCLTFCTATSRHLSILRPSLRVSSTSILTALRTSSRKFNRSQHAICLETKPPLSQPSMESVLEDHGKRGRMIFTWGDQPSTVCVVEELGY